MSGIKKSTLAGIFFMFTVFGLALSSCKRTSLKKTTSNGQASFSQKQKMNPTKNTFLNAEFSQGPKILPRNELLAWFEQQEDNQIYKIPVVLSYQEEFPNSLEEAFIAVSENMAQEDKLLLEPDDSGLGISMADRIRNAFGDQRLCHVWLIGKWGSLLEVDIPGLETPEGIYPFAVREIIVREEMPKNNSDAHIWIL